MKRSTDRILTTHVGSLARPVELLDTMKLKENDRPYDAELFDRQVQRRGQGSGAPAGRVRHRHRDRRRDEQGQLPRLREGPARRLRGRHGPVAHGAVVAGRGRRLPRVLRGVLQEVLVDGRAAAPHHLPRADHLRRASSSCRPTSTTSRRRPPPTTWPTSSCPRPARAGSGATSTTRRTRSTSTRSPRPCARSTSAIVAAGFILQVDDPFLIDMLSDPTMEQEERERLAWIHVEALNHALRDIPPE